MRLGPPGSVQGSGARPTPGPAERDGDDAHPKCSDGRDRLGGATAERAAVSGTAGARGRQPRGSVPRAGGALILLPGDVIEPAHGLRTFEEQDAALVAEQITGRTRS